MATTPFDGPVAGSSFVFDIYNDGQASRATAPALPNGPCNYTDQTLPRCGCRRFWSRPLLSSGFQDSAAPGLAEVCMCSHHACFHEDVQSGQTQPPPIASVAGQENQRPKVNREPLSPVQGLASFHMPTSFGSSLDFNLLDFQTSVTAPQVEGANPSHAENAHPAQDSPMPDTFNNWADLIQSQPGQANGLPPTPAQCFISSQPPSTTASSQARYLRPFAGKGLQTLSGGSTLGVESRVLEQSNGGGDGDGDGAEAIRDPGHPSVDSPSRDAGDATPKALPSQARSAAGTYVGSYQKLADTVEAHEHRLDRLESASFSIAGHDDCHDKHEHTDLRVTELESRVEEVEKILNDNGSITSSRRTVRNDGAVDDATASVVSVSTNATVQASNRAEMYSQLQILQAQVSQLQAAALPSYTKPWQLEVVFLPFPLKGIWMEARNFPTQRRSTGSAIEEWTQLPNTISRATPDPQSPKFMEWVGQGPESNWLLPRAFASGRVIDQRLKSRGLIKTVLVRGPDARSVQLAIHNAFDDVLRISANFDARSGYAPDSPLAEFLGLRQAWVPLRKLHKDSRLRFLSPAEMATPALWDFTFLASSVVMKATGTQRLYITQPEAYLQDHPLGYHAFESGWNWQKLRELSRVYPDSQSSVGDVPEADAMEDCWAWNDGLDEPPSVNSSVMSFRQSHQQRLSRRSSTEPSAQFFTGVQSPILSNSPRFARAQSPLVQRERKASWPPNIRAGSLPPVAPALLSPAQSRRRVSSHAASATPYERRSSPFVPRPSPRLNGAATTSAPKRRFGTRSPSLAPRNTPRWSRTSMSRSPSLAPGGPYGYHDDQPNRERRTTPFYYATPHSEGYFRAGSRGPPPSAAALLRTDGYGDDDEDMNDGGYADEERGSSTDPYDSEMTGDDIGKYNGTGGRGQNHNGSFGFGTDGDEADLDIDVYEDDEDDDEEDELDGVDTDADGPGGGGGTVWSGFGRQQRQQQQQQQQMQMQMPPQSTRPEDIPWAGIEDHMSDGENMDPHTQSGSSQEIDDIEIHEDDDASQQQQQPGQGDGDDDEASGSSQAPSEYSSKPGPWQVIPLPSTEDEVGCVGRGQKQQLTMDEGEPMGFRIHEDGTAGNESSQRGGGLLDTQWG
ncbi:Midasin [Madurella mycetomatis]|uniref:Midasin n=1 Tax=Madurella mycetomatis TaxID=100816 RepID=A0A175W028_9PEZI|nr:Midasin [Madurella mycetomatis]